MTEGKAIKIEKEKRKNKKQQQKKNTRKKKKKLSRGCSNRIVPNNHGVGVEVNTTTTILYYPHLEVLHF